MHLLFYSSNMFTRDQLLCTNHFRLKEFQEGGKVIRVECIEQSLCDECVSAVYQVEWEDTKGTIQKEATPKEATKKENKSKGSNQKKKKEKKTYESHNSHSHP